MAKREVYVPDVLYSEWSRSFPNADLNMCVRQMMKDQLDELRLSAERSLFERMFRAGAQANR